ncbi:SusC/RagA family TonB-linked outer membrane protein [Parabacteroides gordonii]|uniref:SusC/RagA family TonB-linked outer membrane protein n=1 Tax=Parabacteroides gordonii MS-1 = DSM 23371 TaxID=1203610 RepID=A0A0F5IKP6_9BACT|nr:SusC/RagA family TonB-linked outer membrane protein [Parabacteroides gordonii]KKB46053.1 SusC/RagA family TonB-linked outer membrane protein [Parabacteroides gordonii MS-1 = DSM 23371]MCA5586381.1 SusC/RagA family TonB-linked outer membrane protein [Parabacteroides gordonii]
MKKLTYLLFCLVLGIGVATAQTTKITGSVISADDNEPIIGASIVVKGTMVGTVTDFNGAFSLDVPSSAKTLVISYVGMKSQEVGVSSRVNVKLLSDTQDLDEIVVTAMGIKRERKALGYAAQDLKSDELNKSGTTSLANAIQGKLTGVDIRQSSGAPGASAQITIRGARSFDGNNQPLYVIDGMPINTAADFDTGSSVSGSNYADRSIDINPEDIETINVLKGQAASALYGIRASNGVIVITTKRGSNQMKGRPQVTVSTNLSAQRVSRKFERQDVYAQGDGVGSYSPTSSMSWGPKINDLANDAKYGGNTDNAYTQADGLHQGMYYNPKRAAAGLDGWTTPQIYDNVGDFLGTGFTENTNFNISQALNGLNYSVGINNSHQKGIIPSTGMDRWGVRGLVDWKINNEWKSGFSANYSSSKITSAPGANSGIMNVVYSAPSEYDLKGIPFNAPGDPTKQILFRSTNFNNPYWWAENDEYRQHTNRAFGNAYVEYEPELGWDDNMSLRFREQAGLDIWTSDYRDIAEIGSAANTKGQVDNYGSQHNVFNNLFTANFDAKFGDEDEWGVNVVLGNEVNHENIRVWSYTGQNLNFYGLPTISNTTSLSGYEYGRQERTVGFFGSASVSWRDQLYLTVTGRNDYVSTMPRGSRSFFYPSVSLGWEFTKLPFLENNSILNYGKLRGSFAQVGQAGQYYKTYYTQPGYGGGFYQYVPIAYPLPSGVSAYAPSSKFYDANLKPQNTANWEIGTDLQFFGGRIKAEYTYSLQNVTDQIFAVPVDATTGYSEMLTNAGKMQTKSHELSLNFAILQAKDYDLNLAINFTRINNKVIELAPGVESIMLGGFVEPQIRAQAGCNYPNIYGNAFKRDEAGNLVLLNGLPQASGAMQDLGNCSPDFTTGFTLGGRYKRVSISTTWSWQQGGKMYHGTNMTMNYFGATKESLPYHEGNMVAEGIDEATGEKNTVEVSKQDYWMSYHDVTESGIYNTSFLKLRDLTLTYQLPKFCGVDLSVYGFARNILLWAELPNFDPESSQGNNNMSGYFERFSVPNTSSFGGGLTATF